MNSLTLVFIPILLFSVLLFVFSGFVSEFLFESREYQSYIKIIAAFLPFIVFSSMLEGFIRGLKVINLYVKLIIVSNVVNLLIIIPLVLIYGIPGAIIGILSSNILYVSFSIFYLKKNGIIDKFEFNLVFDKILFLKILKVSFVFLVSGAFFQLSLLLLRKIIIADLGLYFNGIFQSVIGISISYFGFIFLSLSTYSFPTISKLNTEPEIIDELNVNVKYIILLMVPLIILIYSFRFIVISILFSKDFYIAENLFSYQFMGDYFKALAWAIGIWLVPKMKLKAFLLLEIILNLNLVLIFYFLIKVVGKNIEYVSIAYLITYFIHFVLNYFFSRKLINFNFNSENLKLFIMSFVFIIPLIIISSNYYFIGNIIAVPVLIIWLMFSVKKSEYDELKLFLLSKLKK